MGKRGSLAEGLAKRDTLVRLGDERRDRADASRQAHSEAVEGLRKWHLRRIVEALRKTDGKPIARRELKKMQKKAERAALSPALVKFLGVVEWRLADGKDIEDHPDESKHLAKFVDHHRRPAWMSDPSLLPKKPPGGRQ